MRYLSHKQAKSFYNRFGKAQDTQSYYENPALDLLIQNSHFNESSKLFEFGFGTGSFAKMLFEKHLPDDCLYHGVDISDKMLELATERLSSFTERVNLELSDGSCQLDLPSNEYDHFVSNYVLDLLSPSDISLIIKSAYDALRPRGYLCLVSLSCGKKLHSRVLTNLWRLVHLISPRLVGGCRPVTLHQFVDPRLWSLKFRRLQYSYGICSEILVANKI